MSDIAALGVRCVINLGLYSHEKALPDEAAIVAALGMSYIHIPVDFGNPTERDFDAFCVGSNRRATPRRMCIASPITVYPLSSIVTAST